MQQGNSAGVVDGALAGFIQAYAEVAERAQATSAACIVDDTSRKEFQAAFCRSSGMCRNPKEPRRAP
jgi:hypothetical protein